MTNKPFAMYTFRDGKIIRKMCQHSKYCSGGNSFEFVNEDGKWIGFPGWGFYAPNINAVIDHEQRELKDKVAVLQKEIYDATTQIDNLEKQRE